MYWCADFGDLLYRQDGHDKSPIGQENRLELPVFFDTESSIRILRRGGYLHGQPPELPLPIPCRRAECD